MKRVANTCVLATVACLGGCMLPPACGENVTGNDRRVSSITEIRVRYDSGLDGIAAALTSEPESPQLKPLRALIRFRGENVAWAVIDDGHYRADENGSSNDGWLAVIPAGSCTARTMPATMLLDPNPSIAVVQIRQEDVSELWAGVFLVHELSHLFDRIRKIEPPNPSRAQYLLGELRAYSLEVMAADLLSGGAIRRRLDEMLDTWGCKSVDEVAEQSLRLEGADAANLESALSGGESLSDAEARLRHGFLAVAILLRYCEREHLEVGSVINALAALLEGQSHSVPLASGRPKDSLQTVTANPTKVEPNAQDF